MFLNQTVSFLWVEKQIKGLHKSHLCFHIYPLFSLLLQNNNNNKTENSCLMEYNFITLLIHYISQETGTPNSQEKF